MKRKTGVTLLVFLQQRLEDTEKRLADAKAKAASSK